MSATLHALPRENTAFAPDNASIAAALRKMADQIENGDWGRVDTVISLIEHDSDNGSLSRQTFGKPLDIARLTGLLCMAKNRAMNP